MTDDKLYIKGLDITMKLNKVEDSLKDNQHKILKLQSDNKSLAKKRDKYIQDLRSLFK